ncbi:TonB-dependent receptor plug domain-containing protein [Thalassotalea fusca]
MLNKYLQKLSLFIFLVVGVLPPLRAGGDFLSLPLAELMQTKVSIANKNEVTFLSAPASVSFFTAEDLNRLGVVHLSDLFQHIPGFYSAYNSQESNDSLLIARGHAQKYANTVLFLLNGQRINDDYTGGINYLLRFINIAHVERVEVIRGSGSALYGSNAFNGVINIISKPNKRVGLTVGSHDQLGIDIGWHTQLDEWKLGFSAHYQQTDGDTLPDVFDRFGIQDSTKDPHDVIQLEGFIEFQDFSFRSVFIDSEQQKFYVFRRLNDQYNRVHLQNYIHQFDYQLVDAANYQLKLSGQWQNAKRTSLGVLAPIGEAPFDSAPFLFGEYFEHLSLQFALDGDYQISPEHTLSAGLEWSKAEIPHGALRSNFDLFGDFEQLDKLTAFKAAENRIVADKKRYISSTYVQLASQLSDYLSMTLGIRYDGYNDVDNKLNPRVALVYQPNDAHVFKYIYGQAYRVPSLGDLYDEESGLVEGNQSLNPTTLTSTELSYNYIQPTLFLGVVLFENHIEDLIGFTSGDIRQLDNIASNDTHGIETELKWTVNEQLRISGHFTHLFRNRSSIDAAADLMPSEQLAPGRYGKVSLQYAFTDQWISNLHWSWRSDIDILTSRHPLSIVDYTIDYRPNERSQWRLAINNVLDKRYAHVSATLLGERDGIPFQQMTAPGRALSLSYQYKF